MDIQKLRDQFDGRLVSVQDKQQLEELRNDYVGRKRGLITSLLKEIPQLPADQRSAAGKEVNDFKRYVESALDARMQQFESQVRSTEVDWTLPGKEFRIGAIHPLTLVRRKI